MLLHLSQVVCFGSSSVYFVKDNFLCRGCRARMNKGGFAKTIFVRDSSVVKIGLVCDSFVW